jgi:hypothetical protein
MHVCGHKSSARIRIRIAAPVELGVPAPEVPMRKISLDVNTLRVESFQTEKDTAGERGTVNGYYSVFSCPQTQCGEECLSGPNPCQPSRAWTNGQVACLCNDTGRCID